MPSLYDVVCVLHMIKAVYALVINMKAFMPDAAIAETPAFWFQLSDAL
ncbi:hypothetical protein NUBL21983_48220 [Klebsiella variicola]|nr:hypothetical protein NUBL21983_48220 [Klebsiella variicola]